MRGTSLHIVQTPQQFRVHGEGSLNMDQSHPSSCQGLEWTTLTSSLASISCWDCRAHSAANALGVEGCDLLLDVSCVCVAGFLVLVIGADRFGSREAASMY